MTPIMKRLKELSKMLKYDQREYHFPAKDFGFGVGDRNSVFAYAIGISDDNGLRVIYNTSLVERDLFLIPEKSAIEILKNINTRKELQDVLESHVAIYSVLKNHDIAR